MAEIQNEQNLYQESGNQSKANRPFSALAKKLAQSDDIVVGVFWDDTFDGRQVPEDLTFDHIQQVLTSLPGVQVIPLDVNQIRSYSLLFKGKMDVLIFPYGSVYPMDTPYFYSGLAFEKFLKKGGSILTTGAIPFMSQSTAGGLIMDLSSSQAQQDVYDKWVSRFGIKYYQAKNKPVAQAVCKDFFPSLPASLPYSGEGYGILVNNSAHEPVPRPPHGNVFPERTPQRQVTPIMQGQDRFGATTATTAVLSQDFETGSTRVHFSQEGADHPLSPCQPFFRAFWQELLGLLTNKVMIRFIEPEYALYHPGETIRVNVGIANFSTDPCRREAIFEILCGSTVVFTQAQTLESPPGSVTLEYNWHPPLTASPHDEYECRIRLLGNGQTLAIQRNAFVLCQQAVWNKDFTLSIHKQFFAINGKAQWIAGTNYYESTRGEIMWYRPDVQRIIADFQTMHDCGINLIRPHFHHLKWFRDYLMYHHGALSPFYGELADVTDPMPDEKCWRILDLFMYLCCKYEIIYGGDFFTLVPEEMGDPRGWYGTTEVFYDTEKIKQQITFIQALEKRYAHLMSMTWDLYNEPYDIPNVDVIHWARQIREAINAVNPRRLCTVGGPVGLGDAADYECPHGQIPQDYINMGETPVLLQELHLDVTESLAQEVKQMEDLRRIALHALRSGVAGICPWSWTRQLRLWQDSYEHHPSFTMEKWDDRLGLHTHEDGTLKQAGLFFKDFAMWMRQVPIQAYDPVSRSIRTAKGQLQVTDSALGPCAYHADGDQCFAAIAPENIANGQVRLLSCKKGYLYYFTKDNDFFHSQELFVKLEHPGTLHIHRTGVTEAWLVDLHPDYGFRRLTPLQIDGQEPYRIEVDEEMCRYWIQIMNKPGL